MKRIAAEFSGNFDVMRLLMHEPQLCTLHELRTVYSYKDLLFFLELIDVQDTLKEENAPKPPTTKPTK